MQVLSFLDEILNLLTYHMPFCHNHRKVTNSQKQSSFFAYAVYYPYK